MGPSVSLAVHCDNLAIAELDHIINPAPEALLKAGDRQRRDNPRNRVVDRHSVDQRHIATQPIQLRVPELLDVTPTVGATDDCAHAQDDDIDQFMLLVSINSRVFQLGEMFERVCGAAMAISRVSGWRYLITYLIDVNRFLKILPCDQAPDDAVSVRFDTRPLAAAMELLGRPAVEFAFSADRPVAQLCFRLCDVAPGGASQRISYRAFNLTHHAGPESPAALRPGRIYRARVELNECAHRVRAGHRLRLAVSTSYWPVVWPAPVPAAVTLKLAGCRLILPERRAADEIDPAAPGAPSDFPVHAAETLRAPANRTERRIELRRRARAGDVRRFRREPRPGARPGVRQPGWSSATRFTPDDPLSARHEARWRYEFRRGDWSVRIDSESVMTSDEESFHLAREVTAREGETVVIARRWEEAIPRGLL